MVKQRLPMVEDGVVGVKTVNNQHQKRTRLPDWFRTELPTGEALSVFNEVLATVNDNELHTVCQEARCPNIHECWSKGTATFMIAGKQCTRGCRFCAVGTLKSPPPLDDEEPEALASAVELMEIKHAVITVVNRDDLFDSGAHHYRRCIEAVRARCPDVTLEFLCSDLAGDKLALQRMIEGLDLQVFAHNVECVPRLDSSVRDPRASFEQSLSILSEVKKLRPDILTKSSLMVGLGETDYEIEEAIERIRSAGVDLLTIGQYLQPNSNLLPVKRFPKPDMFEYWKTMALEIGFLDVSSGPLVRSSYRAEAMLKRARLLQKQSKTDRKGENT